VFHAGLLPCLPYHTSQAAPSSETVPTLLPKGCGGPEWLAQIMISSPLFWPAGLGLVSNQMSYEASHEPEAVAKATLDCGLPKDDTCRGRPLPLVQLP
jgi:hypothetical protein